jgi:glycosyltransferase involved in cell wall biosynthesis
MSSKISFAAASHMIAVSSEIKRHLVTQGAKPETISVVYNGYGLVEGPKATRLATDPFPVLGTVARVTPLKGIEDAIRAVAILKDEFPNVSYLVIGDGVGVEPCKALAAELDVSDRVHFVGYRKDIEKFLARMDLFVFPSLKEGMGIALVEAMAQGLATVATDIGGIPEVITPDCGILVPAQSPVDLASNVAELLRDEPRRTEMGRSAKRRAQSVFSVEAMLEATDDVYRALLTETGSS